MYLTKNPRVHEWMDEFKTHGLDFCQKMLCRLEADMDYYYGFGAENPKHLWTHDLGDQLQLITELRRYINGAS